jgi:hypothetical protein
MTTQAAAPKGLTIRSTEILDAANQAVRGVSAGNEYVIAIAVAASDAVEHISVGFNIKLASGFVVYGTSTAVQGIFLSFSAGETKICRFTFRPELALGTYYLSAGAAETLTPEDEIHNYIMLDYVHDAMAFVVVSDQTSGVADLKSELVSFKVIAAQ